MQPTAQHIPQYSLCWVSGYSEKSDIGEQYIHVLVPRWPLWYCEFFVDPNVCVSVNSVTAIENEIVKWLNKYQLNWN